MSWNYRVVCEDGCYGLRAVYYSAVDGSVARWACEDCAPAAFDKECEGDTPPPDALRTELGQMLEALDKPILDECGDKLVERKAVT